VLSYVPTPKRGARALELGCADGRFLRRLARIGWSVSGIEVAPEVADRARTKYGLDVFCGELTDAGLPDRFVDFVFAGMVLEHVHDPLAYLREIRRILAVDGCCILVLPDIGSWEFCLFQDRWFGLELPRHLYHFSAKTIRHMLRTAGFEHAQISWTRNPNNLVYSLRYALEDVGQAGAWAASMIHVNNALLRCAFAPVSSVFGVCRRSGRMIVCAR
jgi:SAM-dependent methyltransferase